MPTRDPSAAALDDVAPRRGGTRLRVDDLFGDRPELLEAIRNARRRGVSNRHIAELLSDKENVSVSEGAVANWLRKEGIR